MNEAIQKILEEAVFSPSGDNHQPWRFEVKENIVDVFNLPDRDKILYNFDQSGSYIAHGCLLESIFLVAKHYGFSVNVELFPDSKNINHTIKIKFEQDKPKTSKLYEVLKNRVTNRKLFFENKLNETLRQELPGNEGCFPAVFRLVEDRKTQEEIGRIAAINEEVLLSSDVLHKSFFSQIVWTEKDEKEKKQGLYFKTLEIPGLPGKLFKLMATPVWMKRFRKLGLPKLIAKQNSHIWGSGGGHGVVCIPELSPKNLLLAGRLLQRVWLKVTKEGYFLHPLCGVIFLSNGIKQGKIKELSLKQERMLLEGYEKLQEIFGLKGAQDKIILMFRIGISSEPSARSSKMPPEIKIK